jgi:hypothetical protein
MLNVISRNSCIKGIIDEICEKILPRHLPTAKRVHEHAADPTCMYRFLTLSLPGETTSRLSVEHPLKIPESQDPRLRASFSKRLERKTSGYYSHNQVKRRTDIYWHGCGSLSSCVSSSYRDIPKLLYDVHLQIVPPRRSRFP